MGAAVSARAPVIDSAPSPSSSPTRPGNAAIYASREIPASALPRRASAYAISQSDGPAQLSYVAARIARKLKEANFTPNYALDMNCERKCHFLSNSLGKAL